MFDAKYVSPDDDPSLHSMLTDVFFLAKTSRISRFPTAFHKASFYSGPDPGCPICNSVYASFLDSFFVSNWTCTLFYLLISSSDAGVTSIIPFRPRSIRWLRVARSPECTQDRCVKMMDGEQKSFCMPFRSGDAFYSTDRFIPSGMDVFEMIDIIRWTCWRCVLARGRGRLDVGSARHFGSCETAGCRRL